MAEKRSTSSKKSGGGDKETLGKGAFWAFYLHLIIWFLCSVLLFTVNLLTTFLLPPWFLFPTLVSPKLVHLIVFRETLFYESLLLLPNLNL